MGAGEAGSGGVSVWHVETRHNYTECVQWRVGDGWTYTQEISTWQQTGGRLLTLTATCRRFVAWFPT